MIPLRHDLKMNYYVKTMRNFIVLMKQTDVFQFTRAKENAQLRSLKSRIYKKKIKKKEEALCTPADVLNTLNTQSRES